MNESKTTYEKIAASCSEYSPCKGCGCTNSTSDKEISCKNCRHFDKSHHCDLDLIDKITKSHNF